MNYAPISFAGYTLSTYQESRDLLSQVLSVGSVPADMYWLDTTGTKRSMTYADLQALARAILDRGLVAHQNFAAKTASVNAATTAAEIDAIAW